MTALVLLADDDQLLLDLLTFRVRSSGFGVATATDGREAFAIIRERRPNVSVLDVNMPGMNGFDVLRRMRAEPPLARLPVLMLTGRRKPEDVMTSQALGANGYIAKPFRPTEVVERIKRLTANVW